MTKTTAQPWDTKRFRLIGVLPIIIFIARLIQYIQVGTPDWILANCHISNLILGVGMIFVAPLLIRVATIWLIIGVPNLNTFFNAPKLRVARAGTASTSNIRPSLISSLALRQA